MTYSIKRLLFIAVLLSVLISASGSQADAPPYRGEPTMSLGDPQFLIELGDETVVYLPLDELGRVMGVSAIVGKSSERRSVIGDIKPSGFHQANYAFVPGLNLYNRCHMLAHQLGGADIEENIFTGTQYLNQYGMGPIEDEIAEYIYATGKTVRYEVIPYYVENNLVCSGVFINAKSDDGMISIFVYCYNVQPGVAIDYATGLSEISGTETVIEQQATRSMPEESSEQVVTYVLNTHTHRFHLPDCPSVEDMKPKNRRDYYGSREELIEQGYKPCGRCEP